MKTCIVIYNPNSGKVLRAKFLREYQAVLAQYGYQARIIGTEYRGHAKEIATHLQPVDLVISMGGDGTFNEVMTGNLARVKPLVLAHIPVGTTNDIGVMFGYGKDLKQNLLDLLDGVVRGMDIGLINGHPFVYVAGFGKFMQISYETPGKLKKTYGQAAYFLEGVKDFFRPTKLYKLTYGVNGIEKQGYYSFMLISNANRIAGIDNFYKDVKLDDGQFEVLFCNFRKAIDIIRTLGLLAVTDASKISGVEFYKTNRIEIAFDAYPRKAWCVDGEKLERAVLKYEISNVRNVQVMLPRKNINKIFLKGLE